MIPEEIFLKIVRRAVQSPSGHNTQPWLFAKEEDSICIIPDFSRSLPVADPENRELYISLGCAAETTIIAARFYGYNAELCIDSLENRSTIKIILSKNDNLEQPELFSYIGSRQTTRNLHYNKPASHDDLIMLTQMDSEPGCDIRFYFGQEKINSLVPYIIEANAIQMNNPGFKNELKLWMRFSEKEAMQKGDGLYTPCIGMPTLGRFLGNFVLKNFVTAKSEEKRLLKQLDNNALLVMFATTNSTVINWVRIGMVFQRFALIANKLGLTQSFINPPCQVTQVRDTMMKDLGLVEFPQLIIRLGYSKKMHYSFRRRVNDVIIQ